MSRVTIATAVDALRKHELRRLRAALPDETAGRPQAHPVADPQTPGRSGRRGAGAKLERFLAHSPALQQAITLREELTVIFDTARSKADGLRRIRFWRQRVMKSELRCFDRFLSLLDNWLDLIANYFIDHQTSAFVEGLNNKLKVLKRRCYGLRNIGRLFQRLTLDWKATDGSTRGTRLP